MTKQFSITYEIVTPESALNGEAEEQGFIVKDVSFRDAMDELRQHRRNYVEADCLPVHRPRWFTFYDVAEDYVTGARTSYSLHLPDHITESSRMRIARYVGCYGVK
jgi:hypothetical protein